MFVYSSHGNDTLLFTILLVCDIMHLQSDRITYVPEHRCLKDMKNRNMIFKWMARHYLQKFITDPKYSLTSLQQDVMTDVVINVSLTKCSRAKVNALEVVCRNHKKQYSKIYEHLAEFRQTNTGTTTMFPGVQIIQNDVCLFTNMQRWV